MYIKFLNFEYITKSEWNTFSKNSSINLGLQSNKEVLKSSKMAKIAKLVLGFSFPLSSSIMLKEEKAL